MLRRYNTLSAADAKNFLSRRPGFAERWALLVFLFILAALFVAAWFVKYPELVMLDATLGSSNTVYYVKTELHRDSSANIHAGQKVQVRFDAYPFKEFGYVEGRLKQVAETPMHDKVELLIELPNGLVTNHHKTIPYSNGLKAEALVVINNVRLLRRLVSL